MDVSRIEAFNPNRIDWKRLTAKEIMKYRTIGVEVPDIYLQWAQNFINSIDAARNDDVTYENATSELRHGPKENIQTEDSQSLEEQPNVSTPENQSTSAEEGKEDEKSEQSQENKPIKASELRKKLSDAGFSKVTIALLFKAISDEKLVESITSLMLSAQAQAQSSDAIEALEQDMQSLMSDIERKQTEIKGLAKGADNEQTIERINKLQDEINSLAEQGNAAFTVADGNFTNYQSTIDAQSDVGEVSSDYGKETVRAGQQIPMYLLNYAAIRFGTIISGQRANSAGKDATDMFNSANGVNQNSIARENDLEKEFTSSTGINIEKKSPDTNQEDKNNDSLQPPKKADNNAQKPDEEPKKDSDKDIKASQNDGTDLSDKINIDIDEILKRKIRKGEDIG